MVHHFCSAGLTSKKKRFISAIVSIAVFGVTMMGCHGVVQPSRRKLAEMNSFQEGSYRLEVSMDLIDGDFAMQYDSKVEAEDGKSVWTGEAMVHVMDAYFTQDCQTYYDSGSSCKKWRSGWVASDTGSILEQLRLWQQLVKDGKGDYEKKPAAISDFHEELNGLDSEVYVVTMKSVDVDWKSVCDVDIDLLFGGNDRYESMPQVDMTLLYGTEDVQLKAVILSCEQEEKWISVCIAISQIEAIPNFDLSEFSLEDGYPSEEWTIYYEEEKAGE